MFYRTTDILEKIQYWFQIGDSAPNFSLDVQRKDKKGGFETFKFPIDQATSISIDRRYNMAANELKVSIDNKNGELSPDYSDKKVYPNIHDLRVGGYRNVLDSFNRISCSLGYGDSLRPMFTGTLEEVDINADNKNISISAKDTYKKLLKPLDPISKRELVFENKEAIHIIKKLLEAAGIKTYIIDNETLDGKNFNIPNATFELGTQISDCLKKILEVLGYRCYCDRMGTIHIEKEIFYTQTDLAVAELDDYIDISSATYKKDSNIIRNRVIVQSDNGWQAFEDPFLIDYCNGERISCGLESPWAIDEEKRWAVADSFFLDMRRKLRKPTVIIKGDPTLDIGDLIQLKELITTMNGKYVITGIQSSFTSSGYIDTLDLEFATNGTGHLCEVAEGEYKEDVTSPVAAAKTITGTLRDQICNTALSYQGTLYQWGGDSAHNSADYGMDCSHFTYAVYKKYGLMSSYAIAKNQYTLFKSISEAELLPGDLVFYSTGGPGAIHHVGLYLGNGKAISASGGGSGTNTAAKAKSQNACVKTHALKYMNRTYYYARPSGLT